VQYNSHKSLAVAVMNDRLDAIDMGREVRNCCAPFSGGAGSPSNTMSPGPKPTSIVHPDSSNHLATIDMGRGLYERRLACVRKRQKFRRAAVTFSVGGGAGLPSNTMWPGPRPRSVPSGILVHPTVWPQYTNVKDRQADRQRSDSIGRTVLQTVGQKVGLLELIKVSCSSVNCYFKDAMLERVSYIGLLLNVMIVINIFRTYYDVIREDVPNLNNIDVFLLAFVAIILLIASNHLSRGHFVRPRSHFCCLLEHDCNGLMVLPVTTVAGLWATAVSSVKNTYFVG